MYNRYQIYKQSIKNTYWYFIIPIDEPSLGMIEDMEGKQTFIRNDIMEAGYLAQCGWELDNQTYSLEELICKFPCIAFQ